MINITKAQAVQLVQLTFNGCGGRCYTDNNGNRLIPAFNVVYSNLSIKECNFYHSTGRVIDAYFCNINISKCGFVSSCYGVIKAVLCRISDNESIYSNTSRSRIVWYSRSSVLACSKCKFDGNGYLLSLTYTNITLYLSKLTNNEAQVDHSDNSSIKSSTITKGAIVYVAWKLHYFTV